jgi:hypothetical protein
MTGVETSLAEVLARQLEADDEIKHHLRVAGVDPSTLSYQQRQKRVISLAHESSNGHGPARPHSWCPIDLIATASEPPEPPSLGGIVYPGRRHVFSGEPESLKSFCALVLCVEEMLAGRNVVYVDFEMGGRDVLERLRCLGADDELLGNAFAYLEPGESLSADATVKAEVEALIAERQPSLVVFDAATGALALHGYDPNSAVDIEKFYRRVVDVFGAHGAAIVVLDHLPKDREARGKFAIGSERKIGVVDVHLRFEVIHPLGRGSTGKCHIDVKKDRPGHLIRPRAAELELASDPKTGAIEYDLRLAERSEERPAFRPTCLMERVSRYLEASLEVESRRELQRRVKGNASALRLAVDILIGEGYASEGEGSRGARPVRFVKVYRESQDSTATTVSDRFPSASPEAVEPTATTATTASTKDAVAVDAVAVAEDSPF